MSMFFGDDTSLVRMIWNNISECYGIHVESNLCITVCIKRKIARTETAPLRNLSQSCVRRDGACKCV